jgi:para-nitrobenzyl esterase
MSGAAAAAMLMAAAGAASAAQTVRIDTGALKGVTADGVASFRDIPYAAPPVGPLRWRAPQPAAAWSGVRSADKDGAICMQKYNKTDNGVGPLPASEDCLTLNVFAPAGAAKLPVMVWIHGGGLVNGSGTAALYDGTHLAQQGVVLVSINYRLGRFGFFAHPALTGEAGRGPTANYGLMDQIAALQWVKRNIAAFGGDSANVTIFGESAGGVSVNRLMMIPSARGLFTKAIVESGAGSEHGQTLAEAEAAGAVFMDRLGVAKPDAAALRHVSADTIVAAGDADMTKGELPILDGRLLTENAMAAFRGGHEARIPYLIGSNSLEIPPAWGATFAAAVQVTPEQKTALVAAYGSEGAYKDRIATDVIFGSPARALAKAHAATGAPTWLYRFSVVSPSVAKTLKGAVHASDRQYVFQTLNASPWATDANDAAQARTISAYWVAFAKTGNPNGEGRPAWPRYDGSDRLIDFTNAGPVVEKTPDAAPLDAIAAGGK